MRRWWQPQRELSDRRGSARSRFLRLTAAAVVASGAGLGLSAAVAQTSICGNTVLCDQFGFIENWLGKVRIQFVQHHSDGTSDLPVTALEDLMKKPIDPLSTQFRSRTLNNRHVS